MADLSWFVGAGLDLFVHWDHASQQGIDLVTPNDGGAIRQKLFSPFEGR